MTTQQDILRTMMTQLDDASDKIPEGLYLKFCDHLKNLHTCQPAQVALQRSSGPRRCGCCRQVGHDRRNCPQVARDNQSQRYWEAQRLEAEADAEAERERKPVVVTRGQSRGVIVMEVDLPGVDNIRDIQLGFLESSGSPVVLQIHIPGKYKADIQLPAGIDRGKFCRAYERRHDVHHTIFSSRRQMLTMTLPML